MSHLHLLHFAIANRLQDVHPRGGPRGAAHLGGGQERGRAGQEGDAVWSAICASDRSSPTMSWSHLKGGGLCVHACSISSWYVTWSNPRRLPIHYSIPVSNALVQRPRGIHPFSSILIPHPTSCHPSSTLGRGGPYYVVERAMKRA